MEVHAGSSSGTMTGNSALCLEILGMSVCLSQGSTELSVCTSH